ncbi:MAG: hypothetical protein ACE5HP_09065 [Gemmatimonadota bacterium]
MTVTAGPRAKAGVEAATTGLSYGTGALMFYCMYRVLGEAEFDDLMGAWFRRFRQDGSTTRQFVGFTTARSKRLVAVFEDWLLTSKWRERLLAGETLEAMIDGYKASAPRDEEKEEIRRATRFGP